MAERRIRDNLMGVHQRMAEAARRSGRDPESVRLVAVTKQSPPELVRMLVAAGARDLGENYPQHLWSKAEALHNLDVRWHLIGHLQTNKAKRTVPMVRMIHSVDSLKLLHLVDGLAGSFSEPPPEVLLQVNTSDEPAKHGWSPEAIVAEADAIASCRQVPIVGLMTMAALGTSAEEARPSFVRLRQVRDALRLRTGLEFAELSMGMSHDFEVAIEEGATWVRVGSALFEGVVP